MSDLAVCGLICDNCPIRSAHANEDSADALVSWFYSEGWISEKKVELILRDEPYCSGCKGDRSHHWNSECELLLCATSKELINCSNCDDFPCNKYNKWLGQQPPHCKHAYDNLVKEKSS